MDRIARDDPARVVAVDNLFLGREENLNDARAVLGDRLRISRTDVTSEQTLHELMRVERPDVVFDLAVIPLPTSLERPRWTFEQNVQMTLAACEAQRLGLFGTLVHFSSSEAYGTASYTPMDERHPLAPLTPYAASKAASDHLVSSYAAVYGLETIILRPFNNYGPRQNDLSYAGIIPIVIRRLLKGDPPEIFGDGHQTRDFIFVRDTAAATIAIYECAPAGSIVNVASGHEVSVDELVELLRSITGSSIDVRHGPARPGDIARHLASVKSLRALTGFESSVSLEVGLRETVEWYRSRPT